jgi:glyoxylate reductase
MNVLITGKLPDEIVDLIQADHAVTSNPEVRPMPRETVLELITDCDGLMPMITDKVDRELLDRAPKLRMIANYGVGYDNIDVPAASERGIWVSNTPGVLTDATADLTFALILAVARRVVEGDARIRMGRFTFWAPLLFLGTEVSGKTLGIVGLGKIGLAVAQRARGFNMHILYTKRQRANPEIEEKYGLTYVDLPTLLGESDFVSLHVPLSPATRHLIGVRELELMKPTAFLINAARGPVVDESALVEALRNNVIAGAGLDVYENEPSLAPSLAELPNAVLLPHVGSATQETRGNMARLAAHNLLSGLRGELPPNCVNSDIKPWWA